MGVRPRSAISPVTPTIIGSRRPRHRIGLKATARSLPASRKEQRLRRSHVDGTVEPSSWMRTTQSRPLHTCSRRRAGTRAGARVALGSDEDAQPWRCRPRASPPPGSGSRIRQRRPPVLADCPICAIPTTGGGDTSRRTHRKSASPPREEPRRSIPVARPRAYARPGSSTAATPVDLAAAIAQMRAAASTARSCRSPKPGLRTQRAESPICLG